uniref:Transporter n=1 Tax=Glossina palpalis gambiensis TaxID=67801 RepID=A0A1B0BJ47_9MUSC
MVYESSYESGRRPFLPDVNRGLWSQPTQFIYAGLSIAFKFDMFSISWYFLDQASSRIGYLSLALNVVILTYYSVFATIPLAYFFASMHPTLPWGCEGFKKWAHLANEEEQTNASFEILCQMRFPNITEDDNATDSYVDFVNHHIPSVMYFKTFFSNQELFVSSDTEFFMSWQLIICDLFVWCIIAFFYYKCRSIEKFGVCLRYAMWIMLSLLVLFLIRFSFLDGAGHVFSKIFAIHPREFVNGILASPMYTLTSFGPGWGLFITLASFNKFNADIVKSTWMISFGQVFIMTGLTALSVFSEAHFGHITEGNYYTSVDHHWLLFLSSGSVMANMSGANFWSMLFYFMLFLSSLVLMDGVVYFTALTSDASITQTILNLLLILIVCWIYGRERLQRDIEFMVEQKFSTWKVNILRFGAPLAMLLILLIFLMVSFYEHLLSTWVIKLFAVIFIGLPWIFVPGYAVFCVWQTTGSIKTRLKRCCRPTDWYPVVAEDRQRYEEAMGNLDITHQLNEITEEVM